MLNRWLSLLRHRLVENGLYSLLEMTLLTVFMLISTPILLNRLGAERYGLWTLAMTFLGFLGVMEFGLGAAVTRFLAQFLTAGKPAQAASALSFAFLFGLGLGLTAWGGVWFSAPWLKQFFPLQAISPAELQAALRLTAWGLPPTIVENIALSVPRGFQNYRLSAWVTIGKNAVLLLTSVITVLAGGDVSALLRVSLVVFWLSAAIALGLALRLASQFFPLRWGFDWSTARQVGQYVFFMGLMGLGVRIFTFMDRIAVSQTLGLTAVAHYAIATGIANKISALGSATTQQLVPAFSAWQVKESRAALERKLWLFTLGMGSLLAVFSLFFFSLGYPLLALWLGPQTALAVWPAMQILVGIYTLRTLATPAFQAVNGLGYPQVTTFTALTSGLATILLIWLWGPTWGLTGAAWANASSLITLLVFPASIYLLKFRHAAR